MWSTWKIAATAPHIALARKNPTRHQHSHRLRAPNGQSFKRRCTASRLCRRRNPKKGTATVWEKGFFKTYANGRFAEYAVCMLCVKQENWATAEIKYGKNKLTGNLLNHLDSTLEGHRQAWRVCRRLPPQEEKATASATISSDSANTTSQPAVTQFFSPETPSSTRSLCKMIVMEYLPLSFAESAYFRDYSVALNRRAPTMDRRKLLRELTAIRDEQEALLGSLLDGQYVALTTDSWTDLAIRTCTGYTWSYINDHWQLVAFSPYCSLSTGTQRGEDLAREAKAFIHKHKLAGRVTSVVTDCEPSMVKAGRELEQGNVTTHHGCAAHRLESSAGKIVSEQAVRECLAHCRKTATRYTGSSQLSAKLGTYCKSQDPPIPHLKVKQDVATRWWSMHDMGDRLVKMGPAIRAQERTEELEPILTPLQWAILPGVVSILKPFKDLQLNLEGGSYVTNSLLVGLIHDLRTDLRAAAEAFDACEDADMNCSVLSLRAKEALRPCAAAVLKDFEARWGTGENVAEYKQGPRNQPQGFKIQQVLASLVDPRTKRALPGIPEGEREKVWALLVEEAAKLAMAPQDTQATREAAAVVVQDDPVAASPMATSSAVGTGLDTLPPEDGAAPRKKPKMRGMFASCQQAEEERVPLSLGNRGQLAMDSLRYQAELEVMAFRGVMGLPMLEREQQSEDDPIVFDGPLPWWKNHSPSFPMLARVAHRVLAIPASSAQSERLFSVAGQTVTKKRSCLSSEHVELLLFLRTVWPTLDAWSQQKKRRATDRVRASSSTR